MGGRKEKHTEKHKQRQNKALKETASSNYSAAARNLRKGDLGAVIFGCTHSTINECMTKNLFGLPKAHFSYIQNIGPGLVLFLFNFSDRKLHGIFEAASPGRMNIDSYAWIEDENDQDYTSFPAQVRVRVRKQCQPLSENEFKPIIANNYYQEPKLFYFELDHDQTKHLIKLFKPSAVHSTASFPPIPTRRNNLNTSLPVTQNRQTLGSFFEPNVGMSSLPENPNQTSNFSYASFLGSSDTTAATASSSILPGKKWSALFKSESACEASTDDPHGPQAPDVYGANNSFMQENTWEGSNKVAGDRMWNNEVDCGQTWESDTNPDAKTTTDKGDYLQESTWEGSNKDADEQMWKNEAEWGQTWESETNPDAKTTTYKGDYLQESTLEESNKVADEPMWKNEVEWGQTWESDTNPQAKTTTDNSEYLQDNTWEESHLVDTTIDKAEWDQTWESDTNPQAKTSTSNDKFLQGNTWEESESIPTTSNEVEHGQTSDLSGQPLEDNPDCHLSPSTETDETDEEENDENDDSVVLNTVTEVSTDLHALVDNLMQEIKALKGSQMKQIVKINMLEQEQVKSKEEIQHLRNRIVILESGSRSIVDPAEVKDELQNKSGSKFVDSVYIFGGHDGCSWLKSLDLYSPSLDTKISLSSMQFEKKHASSATLNGELYHFGGEGSSMVESFNTTMNQWISRPPLFWNNIHVAGASIKDRLYVVGGANGLKCSSEVEYLDLNIGKWLPDRAMLCKRLAPAAVELNNALYVTGGFDGVSYSSSVERFDPREEAWYELPSMNTKKGCHSMVVLNEKLYTLGGFDGDSYVSKVEYLDTRMCSWVEAEPMNVARGYFGAFVLGQKLYAIGGVKEEAEQLDIVECYTEGSCFEVANYLKAIGKRSHFSAMVL